MPVFDYQCEDCKKKYDVYHKVREIEEDVVCPACGSKSHKRLMSIPAAPVMGNDGYAGESCESGTCGCAGGSCSMN